MKLTQFKQIIREEIRRVLKEAIVKTYPLLGVDISVEVADPAEKSITPNKTDFVKVKGELKETKPMTTKELEKLFNEGYHGYKKNPTRSLDETIKRLKKTGLKFTITPSDQKQSSGGLFGMFGAKKTEGVTWQIDVESLNKALTKSTLVLKVDENNKLYLEDGYPQGYSTNF